MKYVSFFSFFSIATTSLYGSEITYEHTRKRAADEQESGITKLSLKLCPQDSAYYCIAKNQSECHKRPSQDQEAGRIKIGRGECMHKPFFYLNKPFGPACLSCLQREYEVKEAGNLYR